MRLLGRSFLALLFAAALFAQTRSFNPQPVVTGTFGNVVFPAGTAAMPGVHRTFPQAVFPAGTGPKLFIPGTSNDPTRLMGNFGPGRFGNVNNGPRRSRATFVGVPYAVPVYVGDYGAYGYGYDGNYAAPPPTAPQQPNVIVIYPPAQQPVVLGPGEAPYAAAPAPEQAQPAPDSSGIEPSHYLIAFKDHTIYSAIAYWVEGDTLHYFTSPNNHNQVSLSLIDKDLTERLNRESGITMQLPR